MKFWGSVLAISLLLLSQVALAGECDFCVCKGEDTVNSCRECCKEAAKLGIIPARLELLISADGKNIVDQAGNEVARFASDITVQIAPSGIKSSSQKIQGCWHCYPTCMVWDGNRCVQWVRTCDWDFDCR